MIRCLLAPLTLALAFCASTGLGAQNQSDSIQTAQGSCAMWAYGGSSFTTDAAYNRCALDQAPVLRAGEPMPPPPWYGGGAGGSYQVIVGADGAADPKLTRSWTRVLDTLFHNAVLETIRHWHFAPGIRQGTPVRSGFMLEFRSNSRVDTLPARFEWSYRSGGTAADTLVGTWIAEAPLPPFTPEQIDSTYAALLRRLVRMQVVVPAPERSYCLVLSSGDSTDYARLSRLASALISSLAPRGCERSPTALRIVLPRVYRTENGRAVLQPSGDHLAYWPRGLDGRSWRAWNARCVAKVPPRGSVWLDCDVWAVDEPEEYAEWMPQQQWPAQRTATAPGARAESAHGDSLQVSIIITTRGAYWTDTLRALVPPLPRLGVRAVVDTEAQCWRSWSVRSPQDSSILLLLGDPADRRLNITRGARAPAPAAPAAVPPCDPQAPRLSSLVAFLLGDIGDRATAPVTLCFSECARRYVIDPARHTLAEHAHVRFRLSDLREGTRVGDQLVFRIHVDPAPADLLPLVVVRGRGQWPYAAWVARQTVANAWDYDVVYTGGYPPDTEVYVYLIAR